MQRPSLTTLTDLESDWGSRNLLLRQVFDFSDETFHRGEVNGVFKRISRNGVRNYIDSAGGKGTVDSVRCSEGVEAHVVNCMRPTLRRVVVEMSVPIIMMRATLSSDVVYTVEDLEPMAFDRPELTLVSLPKGKWLTDGLTVGTSQQGVIGFFTPQSFVSAYGLEPEDLPPTIRDALFGTGRHGRIVSLPLSNRVAALVADTLETPLSGEMLALQYAARLAELVAYMLDSVQRLEKERPSSLVRRRDADLAQLAMETLAHNYSQPPLFKELARKLGTNSNRLQSCFKGAFGITMVEFCLQRRIREAQQLLLEGKLSVAQVAERVGYAHQSNFATAFSAYVGKSPRDYVRHRAPICVVLPEDASNDHP